MENTITLRHAIVAYLAAVTAAAVCGTFTFAMQVGVQIFMGAVMLLGASWLCAFVSALIPFVLTIKLANRLGTRSWRYFAGTGVVTALAVFGTVLGVDAYACDDGPVMQAWNYALHMAASGAAGGTACWYVLERQARFDTSVRMS
ncbi:hypothetical protein SAMN05518865_101442 [Duganella sp. CF458]|uniref:hypothetical protein n=1 Tax=Duganella sp. CF458 TaxID=1884368 RepID=UPI0008EADF62|nr:hypothetical protein [Duganella sp. CF458]SFF55232.1 hypothetical protein SAMN05518865_101442 [Duganella sp. CF458]